MKMKLVLSTIAVCASVVTTLAESPNSRADDDPAVRSQVPGINPVVQWNRNLLVIVRTPGAQSPTIHSTHSFALMHAAMYDAVNAIDGSHRPYLIRPGRLQRDASKDAAAGAAAHRVLVALYPAFKISLDAELAQSLAQIPDRDDKGEGITLGRAVAERLLTLRSNDGSDAKPIPYVFGGAPGDYQSTPPNFPPQPQFTHWSQVTPFALRRADRFRLGPPPALTSNTYSNAYNQIQSLGINNSTTATPDQIVIGQFWNGTIQNYWNEIAQTASIANHLTTVKAARLFALLNLSLADSVIAFYDSKYTYNLWRPVTAIRAGDADNNPATITDSTWLPEGGKNTAPDPSYPGAHATISAAASRVLESFFRRDRIDLAVTSEVMPGVTRNFSSFSSAFEEASFSRVLAGQHFSFDEDAGEALGHHVADFVFDHFLTREEHEREEDRERD